MEAYRIAVFGFVVDFLSSILGSIELVASRLRVALIQKTKNYVGNN